MELDEIFETFRDRAAEMEFSRIMVRETSKAELKRFAELMGTTSDEDDNAFPRFMSKQSVRFYDPESGVSVAYGFRESVAEDRMRQIVKHQNRQYGWLLVTVYEEFEDFIERTYAWVGKRDWKCWRLKDFGNVKFQDLEGKPFDWFLERVRRAYGSDPKAILNRLRDLYPRLARVEKNNQIGRNLRVVVELIAGLRHRIVHTRGVVPDREEFVKKVLDNCGLWNQGNPKNENRALVEAYLARDADEWIVSLAERNFRPNGVPIDMYFDVGGWLIADLVAHAVAISRCVREGFSDA